MLLTLFLFLILKKQKVFGQFKSTRGAFLGLLFWGRLLVFLLKIICLL